MGNRGVQYTDKQKAEILDDIFVRMIEGETVNAICREDNTPSKATVMRWLGENEDWQRGYRAAQMMRAEMLVEEILEIADDEEHDLVPTEETTIDSDGKTSVKTALVWSSVRLQQRRTRIDHRKWAACKLIPKVFGEKMQNEHSGPDGTPLQVAAVVDAPPQETREEWEKRVKGKNGGSVDPASGASS